MIAVAVRFLSGRYHANPWGRHVNEGVPEWPPSPWRLLRALVASWKTVCPELPTEQVTALLFNLASQSPSFWLPPATAGHIRCYMPWFKKGYDDRTLVFDTFVSISKNDEVRFIWPEVHLTDTAIATFKRLLNGVSFLGRAESWCELKLDNRPPFPNCFPLENSYTIEPEDYEEIRVLVPYAEEKNQLLENLLIETSDLRAREKRIDPPGSRWLSYVRRRDAFKIKPDKRTRAFPEHEGKPVVAVRYALDRYLLPPVQETVTLGEKARRAVLGRYGRMYENEVSPVLAGKEGARPLKGHRHAFYLPMDEDKDGRIDHLTIYAPAGLGERERTALGSIREILWDEQRDLKSMDESRRLKVILLGFYREHELPFSLPYAGPAKVWSSVTPYVLTRFPKVYRDGRPKMNDRNEQIDGPEDQVRREWKNLQQANPSLPKIVSISQLAGLKITPERSIRWLSFRTRRERGKGSSAGFACGLRLVFDSPLVGPLALGYGCHYGLGQFVPDDG